MARPATGAAEHSPWSGVGEVTAGSLFLGFLRIGLTGFGGVATVARYEIVDRRRWLTPAEYSLVQSVGKVLPGANTVNAAVVIGDRLAGIRGAIAALAGLMLMPLLIVVGLSVSYSRFAGTAGVETALQGVSAAAAGMVMGNGARLLVGAAPGGSKWVFALLAMIAIVALDAPLLIVLLALTPPAVLVAWFLRRRAS